MAERRKRPVELISGDGTTRIDYEVENSDDMPEPHFEHAIGAMSIGCGEHPYVAPYEREEPREHRFPGVFSRED